MKLRQLKSQGRKSKGFKDLKKDAKDGGGVAGRTRKDIEKQSKTNIISSGNYLEKPESQKRLEDGK